MKDITITKMNETFMKVNCRETHMEMELSDKFSFEIMNARHDPRVKRGQWDGIKKMYNRRNKRLHVGLLEDLLKWCVAQEYSFYVDPQLIPQSTISREEVKDIIDEVIKPHDDGKQISVREHQLDGIVHMLNSGRSLVKSSTSSGKSLIIYCVMRFYQLMDEFEDRSMFLIVPSKGLVEQMYNDFDNYSNKGQGTGWNVVTHVQRIHQDYSKHVNKQMVITTWQSLNDMPKWLLNEAGALFVDEVHKASASVLTNMIESATGCGIRHGLTGTFHEAKCHIMSVKALFGKLKTVMTARQLVDKGYGTETLVQMVFLHYSQNEREGYAERMKGKKGTIKYQEELMYLYHNPNRFAFVQNLVHTLKGNTLVLFDRVDEYGRVLYADAIKRGEDAYFISGEVSAEDRERIRTMLEDKDGAVVYASVATMSTGVSIKNLHNMVNTASTKSKITILQSIGRLMRKHPSKDHANLFDLVDEVCVDGKPNITYGHVEDRLKFYLSEKFKVKVHHHHFKMD